MSYNHRYLTRAIQSQRYISLTSVEFR